MPVSSLAPLPFRSICASPSWRLAGAEQVIEAVENGGQVREVASDAASAVIHTSGTTGVPRPVVLSLCERPFQRSRLCRGAGRLAWRSVALPSAAAPRRRADDAVCARRSMGPPRSSGPRTDRRDGRVARAHPARAPDRPSASAVAPRGAARRRARRSDVAASVRATRAGRSRRRYGLTQACSTVTVAEPGDLETSGPRAAGAGRVAGFGRRDPRVRAFGRGRWRACTPVTSGRFDDRGRLIVSGRKVDTIVSGGENVMPAEVEAVLLVSPGGGRGGCVRAPGSGVGGGGHGVRSSAPRTRRSCLRSLASGWRRSRFQRALREWSRYPVALRGSCCAASFARSVVRLVRALVR